MANLCGVSKIFKVGGAQAIAAMSLGTETVPKVYKIFGPGNQFVTEAKHWLSLPLSSLGTTFFAGTWGLGAHETHRFDLTFQPYHSTPSKTDWFMGHVTIRSDAVAWEENLHVDYTCLALFIDGLCSYYPRSPA